MNIDATATAKTGARSFPGIFVTFEGGDGAGKSTHACFLAEHLQAHGLTVHRVHEPGGTPLGEAVRTLLLDEASGAIDPMAELFLYEAARAQVMMEVIRPALENGDVVICDRYTDSTVAYQGYGRELGPDLVERLNVLAAASVVPDRTLFMRVDPEAGIERATKHAQGGHGDRIEMAGSSFHQRVSEGFERIATSDPKRLRVIDATQPKLQVRLAVFQAVADLFAGIPAPAEEL